MYRIVVKTLLSILTLSLLATGIAWGFDEGFDYKVVASPQETETPGKIEVIELFWYGCPHCYHLEPDLQTWLAHKPDYVAFRRIPAVLGPNWASGAKVFYAAELLGVLDRINTPLFKAIHEDHLAIDDRDKLADWFVTQGVKREAFLSALDSFAVDMKVRRSTEICKALELDGVPSFLVNGRYMTSPSMTAGNEKAFQVIDELTSQLAHASSSSPVAPTKELQQPSVTTEKDKTATTPPSTSVAPVPSTSSVISPPPMPGAPDVKNAPSHPPVP